MNKVLYSFNWIGGGFNSVFAATKADAIKAAKIEFPSLAHLVDPSSFVRRASRKSQDDYYKSLPLMD